MGRPTPDIAKANSNYKSEPGRIGSLGDRLMENIAVIILTYNEEKHIARAIESVSDSHRISL